MSNPRGNPATLTPWKPGQSGNPRGRSSSRVELENAFVDALRDDFRTHGAGAIEQCRERHAPAYLAVIARLLPKEVSVEVARAGVEEMAHVDALVTRFVRLKQERDQALERVQRLQGSIEVQVSQTPQD